MSTENDNILRKIKKCLKLAESSNEHEAAAAMRQAQALMAKHGLNQGDVAISDIKEATSAAGALRKPAKWEAILVQLICRAFACQSLHARRGQSAKWVFIGRDANPAIASHTFAQLYRQLKKHAVNSLQISATDSERAKQVRPGKPICFAWDGMKQSIGKSMSTRIPGRMRQSFQPISKKISTHWANSPQLIDKKAGKSQQQKPGHLRRENPAALMHSCTMESTPLAMPACLRQFHEENTRCQRQWRKRQHCHPAASAGARGPEKHAGNLLRHRQRASGRLRVLVLLGAGA
nr:DUF2786 domain-containing protein [Aquitalea aquatilis]